MTKRIKEICSLFIRYQRVLLFNMLINPLIKVRGLSWNLVGLSDTLDRKCTDGKVGMSVGAVLDCQEPVRGKEARVGSVGGLRRSVR